MCKNPILKWKREKPVQVGKIYRFGAVVQVLSIPKKTSGIVCVPQLKSFSTGKVTEVDLVSKNATLEGTELIQNGHQGSYKVGKKEFRFVLPLP